VIALIESMICQASRFWSSSTTSFLYSLARARSSSVTGVGSTGSTSTQSAAPGPLTPERMSAREPVRSTAAGAPPRNLPTFSTSAITP
jgi:hypothetical protein